MNTQSSSQPLQHDPLARSRQLQIFLEIILENTDCLLPKSEPAYNPPHDTTSAFTSSHRSRIASTAGMDHVARHSYSQFDPFLLPKELQGGIGTISSRRPSFAAESFTRSSDPLSFTNNGAFASPMNLQNSSNRPHSNFSTNYPPLYELQLVTRNKNQGSQNGPAFNVTDLNDAFAKSFDLHARTNSFHSRRPSQLANGHANNYNHAQFGYQFQVFGQEDPSNTLSEIPNQYHMGSPQVNMFHNSNAIGHAEQPELLESGLELKGHNVSALASLKAMYAKTTPYFHDPSMTGEILNIFFSLLRNPAVSRLVEFISESNDLSFASKSLCLVVNKNGKLDLLLYPHNFTMKLDKNDLVIVDGDRGKDMAMVIDPMVSLELAILFNFLKKREHFKSLTLSGPQNSGQSVHKFNNGLHPSLISALITLKLHHNEDNEFVVSLPTKQVLRYATPKEVQKLATKFAEEKQAYTTFSTKIKDSVLHGQLQLVNVEYQADYKKLIFYYFANFQRIDFRGLIKELFKIYKTRIWLCAVLPFHEPGLYETAKTETGKDRKHTTPPSAVPPPCEYDLSQDQLKHFSLADFEKMPRPNYFHLINMRHLAWELQRDVLGHFYGFNDKVSQNDFSPTAPSHVTGMSGNDDKGFLPAFDPFPEPKSDGRSALGSRLSPRGHRSQGLPLK